MKNPYLNQTQTNTHDEVIKHLPLVKKIANRLIAKLPNSVDVQDLIQIGVVGLMTAIKRFNPEKDNQFKTFAEFRIRGAMLDELREKDWVPRSVRENATKLQKAMKSLQAQGIDDPSHKELADTLKISVSELTAFIDKASPISIYSIDEVIDYNEERGTTLVEIIANNDENQLDKLINTEKKQQLTNAIRELPEKEQMILSLYYYEELNLKEIAAVLDLTESRISQMRTKILAKLKAKLSLLNNPLNDHIDKDDNQINKLKV